MTRVVQRADEARKLSAPYQLQLNSYALAAAAAGVSLLALAGPSEAKIVFTPTHHVISDGHSYRLDFTGDGTTELTIQNKHYSYCTTDDGGCSTWQLLAANMSGSNQVVGNVFGAVAMKPGMSIGPKAAFAGGRQEMVLGEFNSFGGSWINVKNRYLGVKFKIEGKTHYGWVRLGVNVARPITINATLTGYGYETIPNKPIIAGKTEGPDVITAQPDAPGSLGALALGRK